MPGKTHPRSLWAATANPSRERAPLAGDRSCDVCVIGGGYTGLSAALHLAERGYDVLLLEAHRVGWGASGRNGGQLGSGHAKLQPTLVAKYGAATARALWDLAEDAKALVKGLIDTHQIACDYAPGNTACAVTASDFDYFRAHVEIAAREYGYEAYQVFDRDEIGEISGSPCYAGAICDPTAGYLHPLNFSLGLAEAAERAGAVLHEASAATEIFGGRSAGEPVEVRTAAGSVRARYKHMLNIYPQLAGVDIDYAWGGTFCATLSHLPDFGRLADNVFYAQGYTGHGVGLATLGGQLLAEVVAGTAERFDILAGIPQRSYPGGARLRVPTLAFGFFYLWLRDRLRAL